VKPGQRTVCYELSVSGIAPAAAAHVHAPAGENGSIVVHLEPSTDCNSGGCASVDRALAKNIIKDPSLYDVNVHNANVPNGAVRGAALQVDCLWPTGPRPRRPRPPATIPSRAGA
jgi:hypothetical protein